jgi:phosphate starvation-inducible PhoH-like protein
MATERVIDFQNQEEMLGLFGTCDSHLRLIRDAFGVSMVSRGQVLRIIGRKPQVERAAEVISEVLKRLRAKRTVTQSDIHNLISGNNCKPPGQRANDAIAPGAMPAPRLIVEPKTDGQRTYMRLMTENSIVFSIGPAGTGKTYLAVSVAVDALRAARVRRIVLARPAVEAGEKLGFLPGDFQAKVNPYLRPLYDALNNLLETGQLKRLMDAEIVEICPLAYMRGRTLDDAFIILDEAQNTTSEQMKMFLTRMGARSRIVVTGDITQTDLPQGKVSGLVEARNLLSSIKGVGMAYLTKADIVRHPLVQEIVAAYESKDRTPGKKSAR